MKSQFVIALVVSACLAGLAAAQRTTPPLLFESNHGQSDSAVKFLLRGAGHAVLLTPDAAIIRLPATTPVTLRLAGADPAAVMTGLDPQPGRIHYYLGTDRWVTDVPTFARVQCRQVWPGIDLVYYGNERLLEHDFIVAPGADPQWIALDVQGAEQAGIEPDGTLAIVAGGQRVLLGRPQAYQGSEAVACRFVHCGGSLFGFEVGTYDKTRPLVIDPTVIYATYYGGSGDEDGAVFPHTSGNLYLIGETQSSNLLTLNPAQGTFGGGTRDICVAKISSAGTLLFSTYLGGSGIEDTTSYYVEPTSGDLYVTGTTTSTNFPRLAAYRNSYGGGSNDVFLTKLGSTGALQFSTYLGGNGREHSTLDVDGTGNVILSGWTTSTDFPVNNALDATYGGGTQDLYVAKFNASGVNQWTTYYGGNGADKGNVVLDNSGNIYLIGETSSTDLPMVNSQIRNTYGGGAHDVFLAKINANGQSLAYSTYLGGSGDDTLDAWHLYDSSGILWVCGTTSSANFPTLNPVQASFGGGTKDVFLSHISANGGLLSSTYLGGSSDEDGSLFHEDTGGCIVYGNTKSPNFPLHNAAQSTYGGAGPNPFVSFGDMFIARFNSSGQFVFSTYLGGAGDELGFVQQISDGSIYVIGMTSSTNFPTLNAVQSTYGGSSYGGMIYIGEMFVTKYNASGVRQFSTYLGGAGDEIGFGLTDQAGNVYVAGQTSSANYPRHNAVQSYYGGGDTDMFVTKLNSSGQFVYSTYLGGNDTESGAGYPDNTGAFYAFGTTESSNYPTTTNAPQRTFGGVKDFFLTKLTATGTMDYSTYLGGNGEEFGQALMDGQGHVYCFGTTSSTDFPVKNALQPLYGGKDDLWIVKLDEGTGPVCTYSLSPTSRNHTAAAGSGTITVTTQAGCAWTATANAAWLHTTSSGTGSGTVSYSVDANTSTASRTGTLTIAGQTFTVTQAGAPAPRDFGVMKMKVPKKITLAGVPVTRTVTISLQNHGAQPETLTAGDVMLKVISLGVCPDPVATILAPVFPVTVAPKGKLNVVFSVTYECANDPLASSKTEPHWDYRYLATVAVAGDADANDNNCPHNPPPGGIDPVNPGVKDKGCGGKNPDNTLGADLFTDIVVKQ